MRKCMWAMTNSHIRQICQGAQVCWFSHNCLHLSNQFVILHHLVCPSVASCHDCNKFLSLQTASLVDAARFMEFFRFVFKVSRPILESKRTHSIAFHDTWSCNGSVWNTHVICSKRIKTVHTVASGSICAHLLWLLSNHGFQWADTRKRACKFAEETQRKSHGIWRFGCLGVKPKAAVPWKIVHKNSLEFRLSKLPNGSHFFQSWLILLNRDF